MIHIDRYDDPEKMWPLIIGGAVIAADEDQLIIVKDGRKFEVCPNYGENDILRINEVIE